MSEVIPLSDAKSTDDWSDLTAPINPLVKGIDHGDNVTLDIYQHQDEGVMRGHPQYVMSRGELRDFDRCPARWLKGHEDKETESKDWGSLLDALVLTDTYDKYYAVCPETYKNEKGEEKPWNFNANVCKEWRDQQNGKQLIKADEAKQAQQAVESLFADEQIAELIRTSRKQVMLTAKYEDKDTGLVIPTRVLIDLAPEPDSPFAKGLADLKTCTNAHPRPWARAVYDYWYDAQAAMELDHWNAVHQEYRNEFRHILQENYPPYQTAKRVVGDDLLSVGRNKYMNALKRYCQCLKTGHWDDYDVAASNADLVIDGWLCVKAEPFMILAQ